MCPLKVCKLIFIFAGTSGSTFYELLKNVLPDGMYVHVHVLECTFLLPPTVRGDWDIVVYAAKTDRTAIILRGRRQYL